MLFRSEAFLPEQLDGDELDAAVAAAIAEVGAVSMRDMGKVMGKLQGELAGKADIAAVAAAVKQKLA